MSLFVVVSSCIMLFNLKSNPQHRVIGDYKVTASFYCYFALFMYRYNDVRSLAPDEYDINIYSPDKWLFYSSVPG